MSHRQYDGHLHRSGSRDYRGRSRSRSPFDEKKRSHRDDAIREIHSRPRYSSRSLRRHSQSRSRSPGRRRAHRNRDKRSRSQSRSRSRSRSPKHGHGRSERHKRRRSRSVSTSSSSDDGERRRKKKKGDKHRKRSRSRERRERKKEKKEKKKKLGPVTSQWGKYGIISETDLYSKEAEFRTWLVEECKINPETIPKDQMKKQFARFVEDYNTATLPHEKYYNMRRYEAHMSLLRNGELAPRGDEDTYDPNADMQAHSNAHKRHVVSNETYLSKDQLRDLRKVQHERVEIAKRKQLGLEVKQNMGVRMDGSMFDD